MLPITIGCFNLFYSLFLWFLFYDLKASVYNFLVESVIGVTKKKLHC